MVKRIVDTAFWTDMQVIDNYSVEDKYFSLYLMTNDKSTQVGIYALPKKVMSFETGFTSDVIQVLLDRFSETYKKIVYSEETQEITLLDSLKYSVLTGGKPVRDLMERELTHVKDGKLILATYRTMFDYWNMSKRKFDSTIKELFEKELEIRGLLPSNQNQKQNQKQSQKHNHIHNHSHNHNHNQDSYSTTRGTTRKTTRADDEETALLDRYSNYLKKLKPDLNIDINSENIVAVYYEQLFGELHPHIKNQLNRWQEEISKPLVLEAMTRSVNANSPILYAASIIENWKKSGVESCRDVIEIDQQFSKDNY